MANNTKTPVMVLQELTVKRNWSPPEYTIYAKQEGTHENFFHYEVNVRGFTARGSGTSKQRAKHAVASEMLKILKEHDLYREPADTIIKTPKQTEKEPSSYNVISLLREKCCENKLPDPIFQEISDVGPPHCREFTYECRLGSLATRGIAGTKKQAKQLASQEMLDKLENVLPTFTEQYDPQYNSKSITDMDNTAMERYKVIRPCPKPKLNMGIKIADYDSVFNSLLQERNLTFDDIKDCLDGDNASNNLSNFLDKVELNYGSRLVQPDSPTVVSLSINIDIPFTVCGEGDTEEEASSAAASKAVEFLKVLLC